MIRIIQESTILIQKITRLFPQLVKVAQKVYNEWEQDEEGIDVDYGGGGICDDIASEMCAVLSNNGIDCFSHYNQYDYHTTAMAYDTETQELYSVNLPAGVYESGAGYTWTKIPNVKISPGDIVIEEIEYDQFFDEEGNFYE